MAVENITLNLIPTGETPSIHVAQFDVDRPFTVTLKEGADDFTPTGYDIELQVRKVDNNIVTVIPASTSGNVVTFNTTEQMTACSGTNIAEVQLTKDSQTFATLHFYLVVQRDVLAGGLTSESDIYNLTEQIAEIVPEVIGDDYYTKEEVDEIIDDIPTFDPTNYYDKSETDALLDDKADVSDLPDMTNYYDKSETDALLDDKADVSDLPDMTNYYTKSEVDTKITDLYQIKTASGSIVHITDGGNAIPVKSLVSEIVAVESGSGEKSPDNPYTISGFDNGIITRCGKNLFSYNLPIRDGYWSNDAFVGTNAIVPKENALSWQYIRIYVEGLSSVTLSGFDSQEGTNCAWLSSENVNDVISRFNSSSKNGTKTVPSGAKYLCLVIYSIKDKSTTYPNTQLEIGDTTTEFEAYNGNTYTFAFGQTIYGGYFNNKGNLVVTHGYILIDGSETFTMGTAAAFRYFDMSMVNPLNVNAWETNIISNIFKKQGQGYPYCQMNASKKVRFVFDINDTSVTSVADLQALLTNTNAQIVYPLANPITLSITSHDIPTLLGENNIFSNCGDVEVKYFTEKSDGIAELIKAFM